MLIAFNGTCFLETIREKKIQQQEYAFSSLKSCMQFFLITFFNNGFQKANPRVDEGPIYEYG
jgi:hypothetical protein